MPADSLRYTSALAVILAFVFLVITAYISVFKLVKGSTGMPRLLPDITDIYSVWKLFTFVPVLVTAYVCHFNGKAILHAPSYVAHFHEEVLFSDLYC